jgi:hypothetical protein
VAGTDIKNGITPLNSRKLPSKPTVDAMKTAIGASGVSGSYPSAQLQTLQYNDLVAICRAHSITVDGL